MRTSARSFWASMTWRSRSASTRKASAGRSRTTTRSQCFSSRTGGPSWASTGARASRRTSAWNPQGSGFPGLVMNYVVRSEKRVDEVIDEAKKAGAKILKPAAKLQWGGYGGSFADPDGYVWRVGYSAQGSDQPYAE